MLSKKSLLLVFAASGLFFAYWYNPFRSNKQFGKAPIVQTVYGKLAGSISISRMGNEFYEYLGIPYALPPVKERRFEPPEPPLPWDGVKQATSFGPVCLQLLELFERLDGSEDCLFLNVFTPKKRDSNGLPVMVFIHGGAFISGSSDWYDASYFMDEPVILVTLNYRLGGLGFFNTGDSVVRGNMGLKDQLMALKWVNKNIKAFGGDPDRVTLFGESAGAASVHLHVLSPRSKGLFSKAITQSGSSLSHWAIRRNPATQAQRFAAKFGCPVKDSREMIACLKKVDGKDFVKAHNETFVPLRDPITLFAPTIETHHDENTFLGEQPIVLLREGRFNKIPIISGVNSEEGLLISAAINANQTKMDQANDDWTWWVSKIMDFPEEQEKAQLVRKFYFGDLKNIASKTLLQKYTNMFSDRFFFVPIHRHAKLYSNHTSVRLYYYSYKRDFSFANILAASQGRFPVLMNILLDIAYRWFRQSVMRETITHMGTAHADELPLLFKFMFRYGINPDHGDFDLSASMVKLWVSFATKNDADPLTYNNLLWMPLHAKDPELKYLQIDSHSKLIDEPFREGVEFWESLLPI